MPDSSHSFIAHASADDDFVKELRIKLELLSLEIWADSRNLRGDDQLRPEIKKAIDAKQVIVVISPQTINSDWVFDEIEMAEQVCAGSGLGLICSKFGKTNGPLARRWSVVPARL